MKVVRSKPAASRQARQADRQRAWAARTFGCILVFVHCDNGVVGENLIFTLNARRTRVLQPMIDELADLIDRPRCRPHRRFLGARLEGHQFSRPQGRAGRRHFRARRRVVGCARQDVELPLYRILGGAQDRVPAYHSGGLWLSSFGPRAGRRRRKASSRPASRPMKMRLGSPDADD